jgi:hypothetical protein
MEPDRGDAGEPNEGSLRRLGGRGFPGGSLIGTLLSGLYAARARADVCSLFIADGASCSDGEFDGPSLKRSVVKYPRPRLRVKLSKKKR